MIFQAIPHWKREFEGWTDLNTVIYHGSSRSRDIIKEFEWHFTDAKGKTVNKKLFKFQVLVTTYEMVIADFSLLRNIDWNFVVVDEAHRLKNKVLELIVFSSNGRAEFQTKRVLEAIYV